MPEHAIRHGPVRRGTLFLVVGPSGAGKESLIKGAKAALRHDGRFIFPRRYITRPAIPGTTPGAEDHIPVSEDLFDTMLQRAKLPLEWRAHNFRYGVPASIHEHLSRGRHVILNVSLTVVDHARNTLSPVCVLCISVTHEILAQRLRSRGRESEREIQRRLVRAQEYAITGEDVVTIDNNVTQEESLTTFLETICATKEPF